MNNRTLIKIAIGSLLISVVPGLCNAQTTLLAGWDFQTTTNGGTAILGTTSTQSSLLANFGSLAGSATIFLDGTHGSSSWTVGSSGSGQFTGVSGTATNAGTGFATTTSSPAALSLRNSSANGQSLVLTLSTTGYKDLVLSYASQRSGTGFNSNQWSYSTNGTTFTNFSSAVDPSNGSYATVTLSTLSAVNNSSTVYLKYTLNGASSSSGSTFLDNIQVNATAVPEPATYAAIFGGMALLGAAVQRRRSRRAAPTPVA